MLGPSPSQVGLQAAGDEDSSGLDLVRSPLAQGLRFSLSGRGIGGFVGLGILSNHEKALLSESSFQKAAMRNAESNVSEVPLITAYLAASLSTWWVTALPSIFGPR